MSYYVENALVSLGLVKKGLVTQYQLDNLCHAPYWKDITVFRAALAAASDYKLPAADLFDAVDGTPKSHKTICEEAEMFIKGVRAQQKEQTTVVHHHHHHHHYDDPLYWALYDPYPHFYYGHRERRDKPSKAQMMAVAGVILAAAFITLYVWSSRSPHRRDNINAKITARMRRWETDMKRSINYDSAEIQKAIGSALCDACSGKAINEKQLRAMIMKEFPGISCMVFMDPYGNLLDTSGICTMLAIELIHHH